MVTKPPSERQVGSSMPCALQSYGYLQIPAYGSFADAILGRKLFQCLFALYIVADNLSFIAPHTTIKTTAAVLTFISLGAASQTIPDHIFRPTEKAFF